MTACIDAQLAGLDPWRRSLFVRAARGDRAARYFWAPQTAAVNPDPWQAQTLRELVTLRCDVILNCSRQAGKTETVSLAAYLLASVGLFVLIVCPTDDQSKEFLRILLGHHERLGLCRFNRDRDPNVHEVNFSSGGRIIALPNSEKRVRMYRKVGLLVLDEASRIPDQIYNAVRPMLMVGRGKTAMLSTPNGRTGFFYHEWCGKGTASAPWGGSWQRHRISWKDVGCLEDGRKRLTPMDLEAERDRPGVIVEQEYLDCAEGEEFLATSGAVFDTEMWQGMLANNFFDGRDG